MEEGRVTEQTGYDLLCDIEKTFGVDGDGYEVTLNGEEELALQIIWHAIMYLEVPALFPYVRRRTGSPVSKLWGRRR